MTYQETLDYLYKKLPMFSRIGSQAFKEGLTNTITLCNALGNPQEKFKSIHIAGTNGKGSTSHMLSSILQHAGYKTGLYTSPHLKDFRERIKINGEMCTRDFVVSFTERIKPLTESLQPSFFEITVAMAFEYFASEKIDVAVIEVGLGGRLDSTNIIIPELSVITNIGLDHVQMLGDTLPKIAFEKAGIIKMNVPVVVGEALPETRPVFEGRAMEMAAPITFAEEKRYVPGWNYSNHHLQVSVAEKQTGERKSYRLDLPGVYQTKNILTVLEAVHLLQQQGWHINNENIEKGLAHAGKTTGLHGRWEVIQQHPTIVLDVAHNIDGIKQVTEQLELSTFSILHIVIGMVKDKDVSAVLALLPKYANYYFTRAQLPRALPEAELAKIAEGMGLRGQTFETVAEALNTAKQHARKEDLILVCGSVFVVAEV
ncbi:MAG TPA: folylpolyglutamate synthase/dihydrofolate synthase family protein [Chitinophagaceae bacterium]|nr:folylpolyglutamate synthase/dihydrofolate synthase family protein [Chitinophagaceae bacterium]